MNNLSLDDLIKLEIDIASTMKKMMLGDVLHSLYKLSKNTSNVPPFIIAGAALFAVRFCCPSNPKELINSFDIQPLFKKIESYFLADPIIFDSELEEEFKNSNPVFLLLRISSNQFPFQPAIFSQFSRPALLYNEIPKQLQVPGLHFNFESKFKEINGFSVIDFITIGFIINALCQGNFAFCKEDFKKLAKKGVNLPDYSIINAILNQLSADKFTLNELYATRKNPDRRFQMYDFNPFISYPLILPCQDKQFALLPKQTFFHAPVPELVASRVSTGIFYQMYNAYSTEFSDYFGHVFEKYVGEILTHSITSEKLLSEEEIRKFYPKKKGKCPDWIVIDGSTLILFECKATRFSRAAQAIASEEAVNNSLKQIKKGLKQIHDFVSACQLKVPELNQFHECKEFKAIVVSLETLHLINSIFFQEYINSILKKDGITGLNWQILSIDDLEKLQPHINSGYGFSTVLNQLEKDTFNSVLEKLADQTNKTFEDSFLYPKQEELYKRLNISEKI